MPIIFETGAIELPKDFGTVVDISTAVHVSSSGISTTSVKFAGGPENSATRPVFRE
jgi:hypothetical protein